MVTSRSVAQHTEQMFCDFAGQNREAFRLWQIGQINADSLFGIVWYRR
ncbi:MAG TPA: hypothetical protein VMT20_16705 [Terriglobia bacterium]|nr:hypothetical protein [Terriglobia bacterium]